MTAQSIVIDGTSVAVNSAQATRRPLLTACAFVVVSVALDRISLMEVLPESGFTLWDPVPALGLALLLTGGLRFAPVLFLAGVLADGINGSFYAGVIPTLLTNALVAVGYAAIATTLRRFALELPGFRTLSDTGWFLGVIAVGIFALAVSAAAALTLTHALAPVQVWATACHFWVGDFTGVIGAFPVLMTAPRAWERWQELPVRARFVDPAAFAVVLGAALWVVFAQGQSREFEFFYLLILPVIWIGGRHGLPWCAVAILIEQLALISVIALLDYPRASFIAFQLLSLAVAVTGLVLGAVVTERQQAELRLRRQQTELAQMARITTAGALGTAIIHEISQPLAAIATYAYASRQFLMALPDIPEHVVGTVAKVETEVLRASRIVERLRDFVFRGDQKASRVSLRRLANQVVAALADEARSRNVSVFIVEADASLKADRVQIEQVLLNLVRNGIEAAAESRQPTKHVLIRVHQSSGMAQVDVEDNGPGVPVDVADHLFEPFTTSKPRGMGLGLTLSRQIIECHGGKLWWDHIDGGGTRFAFRIPWEGFHTNAR